MINYLHTLRLFSRDARLYLVTAALIGLTVFGGIYPALLNLYLLRLGYGLEFIGLVNAAGLLGIAFFSLPAGVLGGHWGIRRMMIAGLSLAVVGYSLTPLTEFMPFSWQRGWLLITYVLGGLGLALYMVNATPFLMGVTNPEERQHVFSVQAALWPLAGFVGSLIGGLLPGIFATILDVSLDQPLPYRYPLLIAALLLIPAVLAILAAGEIGLSARLDPATKLAQQPAVKASSTQFSLITLMALIGLLRLAGEGAVRTFLNIYLDTDLGASTALIGTLLGMGQLLAVPAALVAPFIVAHWGYNRAIVWGTLGVTFSLLPLAFIPHWGIAGLAFMGVTVLTSVVRPAFMVYTQEVVPPGSRATMSGATTMAAGLSWSSMALAGGYLATALGYRSLFLTGAGLTATGAFLFWACFRRPRGEFARRSAPEGATRAS